MKEKDKEDKAEIIKETSESGVVPEAEIEVVSQSKRALSENIPEVIDLREVFKKLWH